PARQASQFYAVAAPHRQVQPLGVRVRPALNLADTPPVDLVRISVLLRAGDLAAPASDAARHVEVESVLFAGSRLAVGDVRRRECRSDPAHRISPAPSSQNQ